MNKEKGFTLLELIVTVAIIGAVYVIGTKSGMGDWQSKKTTNNTLNELRSTLANLKNESLSRNTTARMTLVNSSSTYTVTTYYSASPTSTCSSAGTWTQIVSKTVTVHQDYEVTGSGMANTCFYRDGSSSGGVYTISPIDTGSTDPTYTINVTLSTGYLDVEDS